MLLGESRSVTVTIKGEKHAYGASVCAEKRKPGKQQILDILKVLEQEQQYAYIQKWPHAISKKKQQQKNWHSLREKV